MQLYKPGIAFPNSGNPWPIMEEASEDGEYYYKEDVHADVKRLRAGLLAHACFCGSSDLEPSVHREDCAYRKWASPTKPEQP